MAGQPGGAVRVDVRLERETVLLSLRHAHVAATGEPGSGRESATEWLIFSQMFAEGELDERAMCKICTCCAEEESRLACLPVGRPPSRSRCETTRPVWPDHENPAFYAGFS